MYTEVPANASDPYSSLYTDPDPAIPKRFTVDPDPQVQNAAFCKTNWE